MAPLRNVELKARDPEPTRTLQAALEAGALDQGALQQRDTYFAAREGRLKLREEHPEGEGGAPHAQLIAYARADEAVARTSAYHLVDVPDPAALGAALDAALGISVVVEKTRRLLLADGVRIHLDHVDGLGDWIELEAVAPAGSDLSAEHAKVAELRAILGMTDDRVVATGYAALLLEQGAATPRMVDLARGAMGRAYAPYSHFNVGVALRDEAGALHSGANVENSSYPQGQCAETSAIGALISSGGTAIREIAVMADTELIVPCGGCRQRLAEFAEPNTPVHLCGPEGVRRTVALAELLPLAFDLAEAQA
ncbi:MAG TPA: cytidine deaminase [Baekduia sp.]|jgi:homotetrameric cytidine deaminase|nr:cytidine deaminase [Baekduia sp.]